MMLHPPTGLTLALSAALVASTLGCFEVRPLDRVFEGQAEADLGPDGLDGATRFEPDRRLPPSPEPEPGPAPEPAPEPDPDCAGPDDTCDGRDDDCDGRLDEAVTPEVTCGRGRCADSATPGSCVDGVLTTCQPGPPRDEVCDGIDDDCDGAIDEGLTRPCDTPCGPGAEVCDAGEWVDCEGPNAVAEACNGLDDDCDGITDEVPPEDCPPELGCDGGQRACVDGAWTPCQRAMDEICDGIDQDCDGRVDEGDGPCGPCGVPVRWTCVEFVGPCPEGEPEVRCVRPLGAVEGREGEGLGRRIASVGDLDRDGVDDFVAVGAVGAAAVSGQTGELLWRAGDRAARSGEVVGGIFDVGRVMVLTSNVDDTPSGEVSLLNDDGNVRDRLQGDEGFVAGRVMAALDELSVVVLADPEGDDGQGIVRYHAVDRLRIDARGDVIDLGAGPRAGEALALGRDGIGRPVLAFTVGQPDARRVMVLPEPTDGARQPVEVLPAEPGRGYRLAVGPVVQGRSPRVLALDGDDDRLELVGLDGDNPVRLPLDAVATDLARVPGGGRNTPTRVVVGWPGRVQVLRFFDNEQVAIIELFGEADVGFGHAVSGAGNGPDGSQLIAVGSPQAAGGAGRVQVYRLD